MSLSDQHHISQFCLRAFASRVEENRRRKTYYIWCFDKGTARTEERNIAEVAQQSGFYNFKVLDGRMASIDSILQKQESLLAPALKALLESPSVDNLSTRKEQLAQFLAWQIVRTDTLCREFEDISVGVEKEFNDLGAQLPPVTENEIRIVHASFMRDTVPAISTTLLNMKWILMQNRTDKPLWLPDCLYMKYNSLANGTVGLSSSGVQFYSSLSPRLILSLCDPNVYSQNPQEMD